MEILGLFAVLCLILIVLTGWDKQRREKELLANIERITKAVKDNSTCVRDLLSHRLSAELRSIANNVGKIHAAAILDNLKIEDVVLSLPFGFADMAEQERIKTILDIFAPQEEPALAVASVPGVESEGLVNRLQEVSFDRGELKQGSFPRHPESGLIENVKYEVSEHPNSISIGPQLACNSNIPEDIRKTNSPSRQSFRKSANPNSCGSFINNEPLVVYSMASI